jgi:hypothetical protein
VVKILFHFVVSVAVMKVLIGKTKIAGLHVYDMRTGNFSTEYT